MIAQKWGLWVSILLLITYDYNVIQPLPRQNHLCINHQIHIHSIHFSVKVSLTLSAVHLLCKHLLRCCIVQTMAEHITHSYKYEQHTRIHIAHYIIWSKRYVYILYSANKINSNTFGKHCANIRMITRDILMWSNASHSYHAWYRGFILALIINLILRHRLCQSIRACLHFFMCFFFFCSPQLLCLLNDNIIRIKCVRETGWQIVFILDL